jgi:hypothetical protein
MASVPSKRTNKFCTHGHHSDRSVAAAIFANGTYFVDMPRSSVCNYFCDMFIAASFPLKYIMLVPRDIEKANNSHFSILIMEI